MSNNIGRVRSIRLCVEPVEVELDDDDGIKWTSLQTAFPGCSGMYFRDREKDCRASVKFDGEKFKAPGGAWNDRQYFVHLSQRCHSSNLNSYESATKTFEKNVQVVQQLISATMGGSRRRVALSPNLSKHSASTASVSSDLTVTSQEQERLTQSANPKEMSPLEQQFADLAKISTGKDIIIEGLRDEIKKIHKLLEDNQKNLKEVDLRRVDAESKVALFETELNMLRSMANDQQSMNNQVENLTKELAEKNNEISRLQKQYEDNERTWKGNNDDLQEKIKLISIDLEEKTQELAEVSENLELALASKSVLSNEIEHLRPLADAIQLESEDQVSTYIQMKTELDTAKDRLQRIETENIELKQSFEITSTTGITLAVDNTRLMERNSELEDRMANVDLDMKKINEEWKNTIESTRKEWGRTFQKKEAEIEVESMKKQISNLQRLLETATRDATDNARRLEESNKHASKLKRELENAELRQQEPLKRQVETLSSDLSGAEAKILELVSLVSSLTTDAHNSRRDMDDLI